MMFTIEQHAHLSKLEPARIAAGVSVKEASEILGVTEDGWQTYVVNAQRVGCDSMLVVGLHHLMRRLGITVWNLL